MIQNAVFMVFVLFWTEVVLTFKAKKKSRILYGNISCCLACCDFLVHPAVDVVYMVHSFLHELKGGITVW